MNRRRRAPDRDRLADSLAVIAPLALAYGVAVALTGRVSAVDVPTRVVWAACRGERAIYLLVYAALAVAYLTWLRRSGRHRTLALARVGPLIAEASLYAITLLAIAQLFAGGIGLGADTVVAAMGAGVHEELLFRLLGVGLGAGVLIRLGVERRWAVLGAAALSAVAFAAAHHLAGEPWAVDAFGFRAVAGLGFAAVFWYRSLAHAVYAHALYDLIVGLAA